MSHVMLCDHTCAVYCTQYLWQTLLKVPIRIKVYSYHSGSYYTCYTQRGAQTHMCTHLVSDLVCATTRLHARFTVHINLIQVFEDRLVGTMSYHNTVQQVG